MKKEPVIRFAENSERNQVLDLLNSVFCSQQRTDYKRDDAYWNWKFRNSVFGSSILTVAEDSGKIVGVDHLWPWELCFEGGIFKAVQPCDTVVHQDYRGRGLFKKMRSFGLKEAKKKGFRLAFNFPNENSLPGNQSLGATYLGKISWWVRILRPLHLLASKIFDLKASELLFPKEYQIDSEYLDNLSRSVEANDRFIQIHRTYGFHQWRYSEHPTRRYGMVKISEGSKQGAIIFTVVQNGASLEMVCVDFVGDICRQKKVIRSLKSAAKNMNADFIAVMNNDLFKINGLWKYKFMKKRLKNMVVLPLNSERQEQFCSFERWSMVAGLHDSI